MNTIMIDRLFVTWRFKPSAPWCRVAGPFLTNDQAEAWIHAHRRPRGCGQYRPRRYPVALRTV